METLEKLTLMIGDVLESIGYKIFFISEYIENKINDLLGL